MLELGLIRERESRIWVENERWCSGHREREQMRRAQGERVREGWCDGGSGLDSDDRERELHSWGGNTRRLGLWHSGRIEENRSGELEVLRVVFG